MLEVPGRDHAPWLADPDLAADEIEEFVTGERHSRHPDRVLATVLFTDIVGSTERAASLGDARRRALLEQHAETTREQLRRHGGREVKSTGDGFLSTFDGPVQAIRCAEALRTAVRPLGIEIRAGIHTGECELIGSDVGGMAVHIAAPVCALARPAEVLVSRTVRDLVVGSGLAFEDRGSHSLKGVPGEWDLLAVGDPRRGAEPRRGGRRHRHAARARVDARARSRRVRGRPACTGRRAGTDTARAPRLERRG